MKRLPFLKPLLVVSLALLSSCQDTNLTEVQTSFANASVPENATLNFNPTVLFEVAFLQASGSPVNVTASVQLARNQTAIPPVFGIVQSNSTLATNDTFVVAMVDLDAPTPQAPTSSQIRHFLGGNFVASEPDGNGLALLSNSTPALSEYRQPTPPNGSDPHRYVFLLFNQSAEFNNQTLVNSTTPIQLFNISQFAQDVGLGDPLGGTFILVGPDPAASSVSSAKTGGRSTQAKYAYHLSSMLLFAVMYWLD